jgi:hypothetical protein
MNRHTTRDAALLPAAGLFLSLLCGCSSYGLSPRETAHRDYSSYVYALYDEEQVPSAAAPTAAATTSPGPQDAAEQPPPPPPRLVLPTRLAVAQVGEVAPPQAFLKKLRDQAGLFTRVESVSGIAGMQDLGAGARRDRRHRHGHRYDYVAGPPAPGATSSPRDQARQDVARMRRFARDMGMDHLLVVGGTIDQTVQDNGLGVLDLTLVGAFVAPSKEIKADARAAAALIDLKSGRVVMTASADANRTGQASSVTRQSGELNVLRQARDEVVSKLAESVLAQCRRRQAEGAT